MKATASAESHVPSNAARRAKMLLTLSTVVCLTACPDPPPAVTPSAAKSLENIPEVVTVVPNVPFMMRVRVRDQLGMVLPESYAAAVAWSWVDPPGLTVSGAGAGPSIMATATGDSPYVKLTATLPDGSEASATIFVALDVPGALDPAIDWIVAPHNTDGTPMLALIDAQHGADWRNDELFAFVGSSALGFFMDPCNPLDAADCGGLTVFSRDWRVAHTAFDWVSQCDVADLSVGVPVIQMQGPKTMDLGPGCNVTTLTLAAPTTIPARIWIASSSTSVTEVDAALAYANNIFVQAPLGLTFAATKTTALGTTVDVQLDANGKCVMDGANGLVTRLTTFGGIANTALAPNQLHIVWVENLEVVGVWAGGYTCAPDAARGTIVLIDDDGLWDTTLAHELGHALGPWPNWGHAELSGIAAEFDRSNLMWGDEMDYSAANRRILTLGQIHRIALAQGSLINGSATGIDCKTDLISGTPCPRLSKDYRP